MLANVVKLRTVMQKEENYVCQKTYFLGDFCLDHSKLEVLLQKYWINLMTNEFVILLKSE